MLFLFTLLFTPALVKPFHQKEALIPFYPFGSIFFAMDDKRRRDGAAREAAARGSSRSLAAAFSLQAANRARLRAATSAEYEAVNVIGKEAGEVRVEEDKVAEDGTLTSAIAGGGWGCGAKKPRLGTSPTRGDPLSHIRAGHGSVCAGETAAFA